MLDLFEKEQWLCIHDIEEPDDRNIQRKGDQIDQRTVYRLKKVIVTDGYHDGHASHNG